jgi:hypothetical protein
MNPFTIDLISCLSSILHNIPSRFLFECLRGNITAKAFFKNVKRKCVIVDAKRKWKALNRCFLSQKYKFFSSFKIREDFFHVSMKIFFLFSKPISLV